MNCSAIQAHPVTQPTPDASGVELFCTRLTNFNTGASFRASLCGVLRLSFPGVRRWSWPRSTPSPPLARIACMSCAVSSSAVSSSQGLNLCTGTSFITSLSKCNDNSWRPRIQGGIHLQLPFPGVGARSHPRPDPQLTALPHGFASTLLGHARVIRLC